MISAEYLKGCRAYAVMFTLTCGFIRTDALCLTRPPIRYPFPLTHQKKRPILRLRRRGAFLTQIVMSTLMKSTISSNLAHKNRGMIFFQ